MNYRDTAREFARAERNFPAPNLRMSEWAEARRDTMTPLTIAHNHAFHVSDVAENLRAMLATDPTDLEGRAERARWVEHNARALLAAIGED